ncbi:hypothetical protein [Yersinia ruckeri]|uniref:hypothetical protein n=1 Tax=Yersinia ruckeri TaxID=29486 RepID=UPI002236F304|nr:hypothetical protein [Yersinia ruckeri]MCW6598618.1 hypothetical protein [Yersinia ruckeri]
MINGSKQFSHYSGELAIHSLVLSYSPPLQLNAALVLDIEDVDSPNALLALTPVSLTALQTILDFGLESFIGEVNLIDYPIFHVALNNVCHLDSDEKIAECIQNLVTFENSVAGVIAKAKEIFDKQADFQI